MGAFFLLIGFALFRVYVCVWIPLGGVSAQFTVAPHSLSLYPSTSFFQVIYQPREHVSLVILVRGDKASKPRFHVHVPLPCLTPQLCLSFFSGRMRTITPALCEGLVLREERHISALTECMGKWKRGIGASWWQYNVMGHMTQSCVGSKNTGKKAYQLKTSVREMVKYGQGSLGLSGALRDEERAS